MKNIIILFLAIPVFLFAIETGTIKGTVFDKKTGEPIPSANVILKGTTIGTSTDIDGNFLLKYVMKGQYDIVISVIGYKSVSKKIRVIANDVVKVDFRMEESPITSSEAIVVTATRTPRYIKDVPVRTEVITPQFIEDKGAIDIYETLEGTPGVRVEQQCQYCNFSMVRLQGLGPDHTQILVDGQPIYSGLASIYGLQQLGTTDIDRIEIVKGAGSALYGSGAIAGAINIITNEPSKIPTAKLEIMRESYNTAKYGFSSSMSKNNLGIFISAEKHSGDAIDVSGEKGNEPDGISDRVRTNITNLDIKISADSLLQNDRFTISAKVLTEIRQGGTLTDNLFENPFTEGTERIITDRYELSSTYKKRFAFGDEVDFSAALVSHNRNATNDAFLGDYMVTHSDSLPPMDEFRPYLANEQTYSANFNYFHYLAAKHSILGGVQYSHNKLEESGKYVVVDEEDSLYGTPYSSSSEKHADQFGIYVQDEIFFFDKKVDLVSGARYDMHKSEDNFYGSGKISLTDVPPVEYNENSFNPRIALKYEPYPFLTARISAGTGFRVPYGFSEDLHLCSGSPRVWKGADLKPEKSTSLNFTINYDIPGLNIETNIFRTDLKNKIGFVEASERAKSLGYTYEWQNIDNAYVQGIELNIGINPSNIISISTGITINNGKYAHIREDWAGTPYENDSKYISRFPKYTGNLKLDFIPVKWRFTTDLKYQGPMYIDYFQDEEIPLKIKETEPHLIIDAKISRKIADKFKLFVGGRNLSNYIQPERHLDDAAFMYAPVFGRTFYGGIEIEI